MKVFRFIYEVDLDVSQIWPDHDHPENPTTEDVCKTIKDYKSYKTKEKNCDAVQIINEWNFADSKAEFKIIELTESSDINQGN